MASLAQPCVCVPYSNLCCCAAQNGITVAQPQCQTLPDGSTVTNPAYVPGLNTSFWTYKFLTDCSSATRAISNIGIPICVEINADNITVEEKIDGCGAFTFVPFELTPSDPNLGDAPPGFQFIKIETGSRFEKGVCVEYRISITGNYPEAANPIKLKAGVVIYTFGCNRCYIVPGCELKGKLLVSKTCSKTIENNRATLQFEVHVDNIGEGTLDAVEFEDIINIPVQFTLGTITVDPSSLTVDTSVPGQVKISGSLGTILPGGRVTVTYSIPIVSISSPNSYLISNNAKAIAEGTESSAACAITLDVIKLSANKCCTANGNTGTFFLSISSVGSSPDATVNIFDHLEIPAGVTIRFASFNGCEAYYSGTTTPVPLNENLSGPLDIDIICRLAQIPSGGSFIKSISYTLISSSAVGSSALNNTITDVVPVNIDEIIYEGTNNLPVTANIEIELVQTCATPCLQP